MPYQHIGDYKEKKKKSFASWYLLAGIFGVVLFFFFLISTKAIIFIVRFGIKHWIYFGIGILVFLILIKKLKKYKRKEEFKRDEYPYR